ncbi:hypothetical protein FRC09_007561 [Ceratobasidium sp. 395]|nr:hypothetical protein FRC09_007561 [Ceratobasidium sp. 395]
MSDDESNASHTQAASGGSKKPRVYFGAKETLALFTATHDVNPFGRDWDDRTAAWAEVAQQVTRDGKLKHPVSGKTCQEKISKMLREFMKQGTGAFSSRYSEGDLVALASTLDLVRGDKEASDEKSVEKKDKKSKAVIKQETAGAKLTAQSLQRYHKNHPNPPSEHSPIPTVSDSHTPPVPDPPRTQEGRADSVEADIQSPVHHSPNPPDSHSRPSSPHGAQPRDLTRALRSSLGNSSANSAQRFERKYTQLVRQNQLLEEQNECLRSLSNTADHVAKWLTGQSSTCTQTDVGTQVDEGDVEERSSKRARFE